ncbi:hypothetical protein MIND_00597300 [Mycena indigotica]|uniref:Uncharacterized protein n=1 Tax=Mycena indigotica TaxID=2126181 RepID=A0A8H6SQQ5_9AGAR|nr:uncharacterized protein MIND_00597300 [Mycena indigotica]KAF7303679.1 hypothetical protein MIND_00597300 [Mycena indigotica]
MCSPFHFLPYAISTLKFQRRLRACAVKWGCLVDARSGRSAICYPALSAVVRCCNILYVPSRLFSLSRLLVSTVSLSNRSSSFLSFSDGCVVNSPLQQGCSVHAHNCVLFRASVMMFRSADIDQLERDFVQKLFQGNVCSLLREMMLDFWQRYPAGQPILVYKFDEFPAIFIDGIKIDLSLTPMSSALFFSTIEVTKQAFYRNTLSYAIVNLKRVFSL